MSFKFSILNSAALIYLSGCIIYTIINYPVLSGGEGWGIAFMIALFAIGLSAFAVDLVIRKTVIQGKTHQFISAIVTAIYAVVIYLGM